VTDGATPETAMRGCEPLAGWVALLAGVTECQGWPSGRCSPTRAPRHGGAVGQVGGIAPCKLTYVNRFDIMPLRAVVYLLNWM
jgi:hypothetical protein